MDQEKNKLDLFLLRKAQKIIKTQFKNQIQLKWILKSKLIIMHLLQNKKKQILIWGTRQT
jgi:predicted AAA+ superfamily ATPase